jgi:DNA adenine methylase
VTPNPLLRRPALRYFGSKSQIAPWIISHFPRHTSYCEPFGGGANVLLQKPRSPIETYNDLDGQVVNFFRVLRDQPDELIRRLELTPYARAELELALEPTDDPLEAARRFFVSCWMTIGGWSEGQTKNSWRYIKSPNGRSKSPAAYWRMDHLWVVAERLMGVQIECRDGLYIAAHMDTPETLTYLDPPYLMETRSGSHRYIYEFSEEDHVRLAEVAKSLEGYCVISGYPSELYADLYELEGWVRVETQVRINSSRTNRERPSMRTECLWISPRTWAALQAERAMQPLLELGSGE